MKIYKTLKQLVILFVLSTTALFSQAQDFNNIEFIENKGQWDSRVRFKGDVGAGAFFIRDGGFTVLKHNQEDFTRMQAMLHGHNEALQKAGKMILRSHALNVDFVGASKNMQIIPDKMIPTYNNYFYGSDPSAWATECRIYQAITLKDVYPNVDVRYYTDRGTLKYDIIARPGADIKKIALRYTGVEKMEVKNKELVAHTSVGELRESFPYTYQPGDKGRRELTCRYVVKDNVVSFDVKGYDPSSTLVIDPFLIFCTFSGATADNWGFTATYGPDGTFFGGGIVRNASGFPVSPGAFQTEWAGGTGDHPGEIDMGIIKLSPTGSNRIYATYIGGSGNEQPHSLIVDNSGNLIIAGRSNSPLTGAGAYPVTGGAAGVIGTTAAGYDIVVTKLNAAGTGLIGSKRIGGSGNDGVNISIGNSAPSSLDQNYGDGSRSEVIIDNGGNVYVASATQSPDFPVSAGAFQTTFGGPTNGQDGVVLKFTQDLSALTFASFLGGDGNDAAYVLALGATGEIYVAGGTESHMVNGVPTNSFPGNHAGTIGATPRGGIDGFIAQIANNGSSIIRSTFIGTNGIDQVYGIQFDRNGFPYVMGQTTGNWQVVNAAYSEAGSKQFISKLQPDLSANVYSTIFGSPSVIPNISPTAFLVDRCENVYVSGWGGEVAPAYQIAGTTGMGVTPDALKPTTDGKDFYFFVLKKDAVSRLYASFFGQNQGTADHVDGGTSRFDASGVIYQAICANCGNDVPFPTTPGSWSPVHPASAYCNLAMVKMSFNLAGVGSDVLSAIGGVPLDTAGCLPLTVTFTDQVRNAVEYIWNFGEGPDVGPLAADVGFTQQHTYNTAGTYRVMLVAIDPASCNVRDTSYVNINVGDLRADLAGAAVKLLPCESFNYRFDNLSTTNPVRPFTDTSFLWNFGDGTPSVIAGLNSINHTYPAAGSYVATLTLLDSAYCNFPDSIKIPVEVAINVDAAFTTDPAGCAPYTASFDNTTAAGQTYEWNFGDPGSGAANTSTEFEPTHLYNTPGTYVITLIAINPNTCNLRDTTTFTIVVAEKPTAAFTYTPITPTENMPNVFTNTSSPNAVSFKWIFGDGDTLLTTSREPVEHQYNATGTFQACLVAYNAAGCPDTTCLPVTTIIVPALDVPNAFTPNSRDANSIIYVRGFGIAKMRFIIWNRWGQKVFETNNRLQGWDGKVKGVVQPMDVYAYTLDVEFFDGTKATKKGDITLIR